MRSTLQVCCILLICAFMAFGQLSTHTDKVPIMAAVLEIKRQTYCSSRHMRLDLKATFTNSSSEPILLSRRTKSSLHGIVSPIDGGDPLEFHTPMFEVHLVKNQRPTVPDIKNFVSLGPGESFSINTNFDRIVVRRSRDDDDGDLLPAKYTLKMTFDTWFYHPNDIAIFQERWKGKGILWTEGITSRPVEFEILKNPKIVRCKESVS